MYTLVCVMLGAAMADKVEAWPWLIGPAIQVARAWRVLALDQAGFVAMMRQWGGVKVLDAGATLPGVLAAGTAAAVAWRRPDLLRKARADEEVSEPVTPPPTQRRGVWSPTRIGAWAREQAVQHFLELSPLRLARLRGERDT
mmetsp:Transcript_92618/g.288759  ORF Transcript_92618/g.288759 Transcript_92618/m.288759 type:complete len:142 (-) Transcript_92618:121-546(-)